MFAYVGLLPTGLDSNLSARILRRELRFKSARAGYRLVAFQVETFFRPAVLQRSIENIGWLKVIGNEPSCARDEAWGMLCGPSEVKLRLKQAFAQRVHRGTQRWSRAQG